MRNSTSQTHYSYDSGRVGGLEATTLLGWAYPPPESYPVTSFPFGTDHDVENGHVSLLPPNLIVPWLGLLRKRLDEACDATLKLSHQGASCRRILARRRVVKSVEARSCPIQQCSVKPYDAFSAVIEFWYFLASTTFTRLSSVRDRVESHRNRPSVGRYNAAEA